MSFSKDIQRNTVTWYTVSIGEFWREESNLSWVNLIPGKYITGATSTSLLRAMKFVFASLHSQTSWDSMNEYELFIHKTTVNRATKEVVTEYLSLSTTDQLIPVS